ncbi:MAG: sialidase family protein, partial [Acidimicrobiales bacterium]
MRDRTGSTAHAMVAVMTIGVIAAAAPVSAARTAAGAGTSAAVRVSPNARIGSNNSPLRGAGQPGLAVDPSNPRHIVEVDEDYVAGTCRYHVTFDGGQSWSGGTLKAPAGFETPACHQFDIGGYGHSAGSVAFGAGQNVYTTFSSQKGKTDESVLVARSTDGGRTFGPAVVVMDGPLNGGRVYQRPELAAQGSHVYVDAWVGAVLGAASGFGSSTSNIPGCGKPCGYGIAVATSTDGGSTWGAPVAATAQTMPGQAADAAPIGIAREQSQPAVAANGDVYLAWRSLVSVKPDLDELVVAKSSDGGATWARVVVGSTATPIPGLRAPKL